MGTRVSVPLAVGALWAVLLPVAGRGSVAEAQAAQRVDRVLAAYNRPDAPGVAVAITDHGRITYKRAYGLANLENQIPIASDTRFELASVSKQFTALAVLLLQREGKLSLDDPVRTHVPELPRYADAIQIRHLIHHTSGLPEYLTIARLAGSGDMDVLRFDDVLGMLERWEGPDQAPGSGWRYTNTNYALLAEIIARVTREPFSDWMARHVFEPLRMHDTFIQTSAVQVIPHRADGYREQDGTMILGREAFSDFPGPARVYSTLDDMVKWVENFRTMTVGGEDVMRAMTQPAVLRDGTPTDYAGGLYVWRSRGATVLSHSGVGGGFRTNITYSPDAEVGIVVLSNGGSIEPADFGLRVLGVYLGHEPGAAPGSPTSAAGSPPRLAADAEARLSGRYVIEGVGVGLAIWRDGNQWMGAMEGVGVGRMYVVAETELATDDGTARIAFVAGEGGSTAAPRIRVTLADRVLWAARAGVTIEAADGDYAGRYYSSELNAVYELVVADSVLHLRRQRTGDIRLHLMTPDRLAAPLGILYFERDDDGRIRGFTLRDELLPARGVRFSRMSEPRIPRG